MKEQFIGLIHSPSREVIRDFVKRRSSSALAETDRDQVEEVTQGNEETVVVTEEERKGNMIVRAIVRKVIPAPRVVKRDARSCCVDLLNNTH